MIWIFLLIFGHLERCEAVLCHTCVETSGACVQFEDCGNNYCLYEKITSNRMSTIRRSCQKATTYKFDDGSVIDLRNQCVRRQTATHAYEVKVCNDYDHCNSQCGPTAQIPLRRCYSCVADQANDCTGGTCWGRFCTYERRFEDQLMRIEKSCTNNTFLQLPDGKYLTDVNVCETRNYRQNGVYFGKICDEADYCNAACTNPIQPPDDKMLQCSECQADNAMDCNSGRWCTGKYCVFVRKESRNGISVTRTCNMEPTWEFPDRTRTRTLNECEARTTNSENYLVEVCNSGDNCANACVQQPILTTQPVFDPMVNCYMCTTTSGADCYSGSCRGYYCYYYLVFDRSTRAIRAQRGCSAQRELDLDDTPIDAYGVCRQLAKGDRIILANTCDSMDHCDSGCTQIAASLTNEVVCTSCEGAGSTCQGATCTGAYCYYYREFDTNNGQFVHRGCTNNQERVLPNGKFSRGYGQCDYGNIGSTTFVYNTCNSSNYCDTLCVNAPLQLTTSTWSPLYLTTTKSAGTIKIHSLFVVVLMFFWR